MKSNCYWSAECVKVYLVMIYMMYGVWGNVDMSIAVSLQPM